MKGKSYINCDNNKCVECHACEVACKAYNEVEPGIKWRWVESIWEGDYPNVKNFSYSISCYQCQEAPCVEACLSKAITQDSASGIVFVDQDKCQSNRDCFEKCPYQIPQFGISGKMEKCDLCHTLVEQGKEPVCVSTCPSGALSLVK